MAKPKVMNLKATNGTVHGNDTQPGRNPITFCKRANDVLKPTKDAITCGLCQRIAIARENRAAQAAAKRSAPGYKNPTPMPHMERKATRAKVSELQVIGHGGNSKTGARTAITRVKPASFTVTDGRMNAAAINRQTDRGDLSPLVMLRGIAYRVSVHQLLGGGGFLAIWFADGRVGERDYRTMTWKLRKGYNDESPMYENMIRTISDLVIADVKREDGTK